MLSFSDFKRIWVVDFEFRAEPSERQKPVCVVAHEVISGKTLSIWLQDETIPQPYPTTDDDLYIAYFSSAEWNCHLALGWELPKYVLDLFVEFRNITNHSGTVKEAAGLLAACRYFGIESIEQGQKDAARDLILKGSPYSENDKEFIMKYCASDVLETVELFSKMIVHPDFNLGQALFRGEYMKTVAVMEFNGIPVDIELLHKIQSKWDSVKKKLIEEVDVYGFYDENCTFKQENFVNFITQKSWNWATTPTGKYKLDDDTFKEMALVHPELQPIKELRSLISKLNIKNLVVGSDGRSRAMISPFSTKTGRNAPKGEKSRATDLRPRFMFGLPACLRSLMKPEKGTVLAYIDYSQQEFFIAAVLSKDAAMRFAYDSGDPYLAFAKLAGAAPENATKHTHKEVRKLFKSCVLGVQYGLGADSLAINIGKPLPYAKELLEHHKRVFKDYWQWGKIYWHTACLEKSVQTCFGWRMKVFGVTNKEMLTVRNFPIQATGAEILRVACILLVENNIKIIAPVHDAIMIECKEETADFEINFAKTLMENASEIVLGSGNRLKTDVDLICYPNRFIDEKGAETWGEICKVLQDVD